MPLTDEQQAAVDARGDVVVVAGAGTGKTRTLVERFLDCLARESPPVAMDEVLLVTYTEAAAAEMRHRIRTRIEEEMRACPDKPIWAERLALFETTHLGTLHSFCLKLVREHFYELELDPQVSVLTAEETALLASEVLGQVLDGYYSGRNDGASFVLELIQGQARGRDQEIRRLVLKVHDYTQTLPDAAGWFTEQSARFRSGEPDLWRTWLAGVLETWPAQWRDFLADRAPENDVAARCLVALTSVTEGTLDIHSALQSIMGVVKNVPRGKKTEWKKPLGEFLNGTEFLLSVLASRGAGDPLAQDWAWVKDRMLALLWLVQDFQTAFTEAKRQLGMVDFHDLEQCALRLLWDAGTDRPTAVAQQWREQLRFVFVDEYQDINAAQDRILQGLSREGSLANRFLVGDVKQSIYRFRLANPHIFQAYVAHWKPPRGSVVALRENFRSRAGILAFVNSFFESLMTPAVGGVDYDDQARLFKGNSGEASPADHGPEVELQLVIHPKTAIGSDEVSSNDAVVDLTNTEREARMVAARLRELQASGFQVRDEISGDGRSMTWRDAAILLRAPSGKAEIYSREFMLAGIPLQVVRGGFYDSTEILDLLSLLRLLDNPLQDIPALAVLRSPFVGLSLEELAEIRLADAGAFYAALVRFHESAKCNQETAGRVERFLSHFARWRRLARQLPLSRCLEIILADSRYDDWILTQPRGSDRYQNVQRFCQLARQFDQFQRQGLFRFLTFVEARREAETEPDHGPIFEEDAVRLMSIHRSKGLEFPIVVVVDLGKSFNEQDLRAELILDEILGLCPQVRAPVNRRRYPSLPYWLASRRQAVELRGEEMRLLYVAMTRARDRLIISSTVTEKKLSGAWKELAQARRPADAHSCADWLARWCASHDGPNETGVVGQNQHFTWRVHRMKTKEPAATPSTPSPPPDESTNEVDAAAIAKLRERLAWQYSFGSATRLPAKVSVSALRDQELAAAEGSAPWGDRWRESDANPKGVPRKQGGNAVDLGQAHHRFLQWMALDACANRSTIAAEAGRLVSAGILTPDESALLDLDAVAAFWQSDQGSEARAKPDRVRRELPFTARFSLAEIAELTGTPPAAGEDFVVVQGVADLVLLLPGEMRLLDFKTDRVAGTSLENRTQSYTPQLRLYAAALTRIYRRPVSACWIWYLHLRQPVQVPLPPQ